MKHASKILALLLITGQLSAGEDKISGDAAITLAYAIEDLKSYVIYIDRELAEGVDKESFRLEYGPILNGHIGHINSVSSFNAIQKSMESKLKKYKAIGLGPLHPRRVWIEKTLRAFSYASENKSV